MNEKVLLVKAKGDNNWGIRIKSAVSLNQINAMNKLFSICEDSDYVEIKPCCCIVERMIHLKDIERYNLKKEDILEEMIIR